MSACGEAFQDKPTNIRTRADLSEKVVVPTQSVQQSMFEYSNPYLGEDWGDIVINHKYLSTFVGQAPALLSVWP